MNDSNCLGKVQRVVNEETLFGGKTVPADWTPVFLFFLIHHGHVFPPLTLRVDHLSDDGVTP